MNKENKKLFTWAIIELSVLRKFIVFAYDNKAIKRNW